MKVKDLIKYLEEQDPDSDVIIQSVDSSEYYDIWEMWDGCNISIKYKSSYEIKEGEK